eukprot:COSAG01_NODE_453_length_16866_cov_30.622175_6_plen_138_part_00
MQHAAAARPRTQHTALLLRPTSGRVGSPAPVVASDGTAPGAPCAPFWQAVAPQPVRGRRGAARDRGGCFACVPRCDQEQAVAAGAQAQAAHPEPPAPAPAAQSTQARHASQQWHDMVQPVDDGGLGGCGSSRCRACC